MKINANTLERLGVRHFMLFFFMFLIIGCGQDEIDVLPEKSTGIVKSGVTFAGATLQNFQPSGTEPVGTEITLVDIRDGKAYICVKAADGRWWMGENLKYMNAQGSFCRPHNDDVANISIYGYLYDWQTATGSAPTNWSLPSDEEWKVLERGIGMTQADSDKTGYRGGRTVASRFAVGGDSHLNMKIGGAYNNDYGGFTGFTSSGWWSSSNYPQGTNNAYYRGLFNDNSSVFRGGESKSTIGFYVRYIRDL